MLKVCNINFSERSETIIKKEDNKKICNTNKYILIEIKNIFLKYFFDFFGE